MSVRCPKCNTFLTEGVKVCPICKTIIDKSIDTSLMTEDSYEKDPKLEKVKKNILTIKNISIILIIITVSLGVYFTNYLFTPKVRILSAINKSLEKVPAFNTNEFSTLLSNETANLKTNLNFETDTMVFIEEKASFEIDAEITNKPKAEKLLFNLIYSESSNSILSLEGLLNKDHLYFNINKVTDNFYFTDGKYQNIFENNDDYIYLFDILKQSILNSLKNDDFKSEKISKTLSDTNFELNKFSLTINEKLINKITVDFYTKIKSDEKAITAVAKSNIFGNELSNDKIITEINKEIDNLNNADISEEEIATINLYIKNYNDIYIFEIENEKNALTFYSYSINEKSINQLILFSDDEELLNILIKEDELNKYNITGDISDLFNIDGTYEKDNDTTTSNIKLRVDKELTATFNLINTNKEITNNKKYSNTFEFSITSDYINLTLIGDTTFDFERELIEEKNIDNAKSVDDISEEEINKIIEQLNKSNIYNNLY